MLLINWILANVLSQMKKKSLLAQIIKVNIIHTYWRCLFYKNGPNFCQLVTPSFKRQWRCYVKKTYRSELIQIHQKDHLCFQKHPEFHWCCRNPLIHPLLRHWSPQQRARAAISLIFPKCYSWLNPLATPIRKLDINGFIHSFTVDKRETSDQTYVELDLISYPWQSLINVLAWKFASY